MSAKIIPAPSEYPWKAIRSGGVFKNLFDGFYPGFWSVLRWKLERGPVEEGSIYEEHNYQPNVLLPDMDAIWQPQPDQIVATWVGHSTFLIQMGGLNFVTDPHFGNFCAPVPAKEFQRQSPPGLRIDQLPRIDAVLLTHNHYDHLDHKSLSDLAAFNRSAYDEELPIICPTGVGKLLQKWGFQAVTELSWGESLPFGYGDQMMITSLPAQHGSARHLFDTNQTLWCGYLLDSQKHRVAFLGDTGYAPFFKELGERYPGINLAFIPIGAYRPHWFMKSVHLNPEEAVQVHKDLGAEYSIAMHWGTFLLGDEPVSEPRIRFIKALIAEKVSKGAFRNLAFGETLTVSAGE